MEYIGGKMIHRLRAKALKGAAALSEYGAAMAADSLRLAAFTAGAAVGGAAAKVAKAREFVTVASAPVRELASDRAAELVGRVVGRAAELGVDVALRTTPARLVAGPLAREVARNAADLALEGAVAVARAARLSGAVRGVGTVAIRLIEPRTYDESPLAHQRNAAIEKIDELIERALGKITGT